MKSLPAVLSILIIACLSLGYRPVFAADDAARVVYHADFSDPRRFSAMLTSINNMVVYYENELLDYDIRIVFVSHGIRFLTDNSLKDTPFTADAALEERRANLRGRLATLNNVHGVKLELCDITRSEIGLSEDALYGGVQTVPSGVVRIAKLQSDGFSYIKIE
jgi:intracellular sulfur oxidation DsrE/DsrF family protein